MRSVGVMHTKKSNAQYACICRDPFAANPNYIFQILNKTFPFSQLVFNF